MDFNQKTVNKNKSTGTHTQNIRIYAVLQVSYALSEKDQTQ